MFNLKILLWPVALVVETVSVLVAQRESGFGDWVKDRRVDDPNGKWWETRASARRNDPRTPEGKAR